MNTDTPLTNYATFEVRTKNPVPMEVVPTSMARELERELNESNRLKNLALSRMDDALEKAESLSTPDCHICHNKCQRPLCILSKQLAEAKAEVERLRDALDTLTLVVGLTPVAGNKSALQEAYDLARKALKQCAAQW